MAPGTDNLDRRNQRMLAHLIEAGQWDRALDLAPALLAEDPEDWQVHAMIAHAALNAGDHLKCARFHAETALRLRPEDSFSHLLVARVHGKSNRLLDAKRSLLEALKFDPEDAALWREFGWNCHLRGDGITAAKAVEQARALNPVDPGLEILATAVAGQANHAGRLDAFGQIEGYERALRHDPEDAWAMFNIGQVYLHELDDAANACEWFQRAARIDPTEPAFRKGLHAAIRRNDPVLRVLHFPWNLVKRIHRSAEHSFAKHRIRFLLMAPLWFVFGGTVLAALGLWMVFLLGPAKVYEWLTTTEALRESSGVSSYRSGIHRLPYPVRLGAFLSITPLFFLGVWWFLTSEEAKAYHDVIIGGAMFVAIAIGIWWSATRVQS